VVDTNVVITSDNNSVYNVIAYSSYHPVFTITGSHNRLATSVAICPFLNVSGCIYVAGNANEVLNTVAHVDEACCGPDTERAGIRVAGDANTLRLNQVTNPEGPGILVTGVDNTITNNTALGAAIDLQDANGDCVHNTWTDNVFVTADPPCLGTQSTPSAVSAR
jgi:parallel beta-helix repeat protein